MGANGMGEPDAWKGRERGSERRHPRSPLAPLTAVSGASRGERRNTEHREYLLDEGRLCGSQHLASVFLRGEPGEKIFDQQNQAESESDSGSKRRDAMVRMSGGMMVVQGSRLPTWLGP